MLWIELPWPENPANTYARRTETLNNCFDLIRSHQQCISWSPPRWIGPATTDCRADTLQQSQQSISHTSDVKLSSRGNCAANQPECVLQVTSILWNVYSTFPNESSLSQTGMSVYSEELLKELQPPESHQPERVVELCYGERGFYQLQSRRFAPCERPIESDRQWRHTAASGTRLVGQEFQLMQDNDPTHTSKLCHWYIKSKQEQQVLQLISWPV